MMKKNPHLKTIKYKTCRRYNEPGHAHSLTFSCYQRRPFLVSDRSRHWMIDAINLASDKHTLDVWAYVIMPEHVHLLIWPQSSDYSISAILTTLKQSISKRAVLYVKANTPEYLPKMTDVRPNGRRIVRFWQRGGGFDRNLWKPKLIWNTIDYIHNNPVRRGLCASPSDWKWSSARSYAGREEDAMVRIGFQSLPADPRQ